MKIICNTIILSLAIIGLTISAFATSTAAAEINEEKVGKEIRTMAFYGVFDIISYKIEGNKVILSGKVYNATNRKSAERRIRKLEGVEEVVNNIEILPYSGFDNRIRRNTLRAFYRTGGVYRYLQGVNPSIRIIVKRGHLTLEGYVRTKGDSRVANIIARGVPGTFSVTNNLVVTRENIKF